MYVCCQMPGCQETRVTVLMFFMYINIFNNEFLYGLSGSQLHDLGQILHEILKYLEVLAKTSCFLHGNLGKSHTFWKHTKTYEKSPFLLGKSTNYMEQVQ